MQYPRDSLARDSSDDVPLDIARLAWRQRQQIAELEARLRAARTQVDAIERSRSWRLTQPLRKIAELLRRLPTADAQNSGRARLPTFEDHPDAVLRHPARHLFVDVTWLATGDAYGGVAQVTNSILSELLFAPPRGWRVVPVALSGSGYFGVSGRVAHRFDGVVDEWDGRRVCAAPGDIFLGLDLNRDHAEELARGVERLRAEGASIAFVVYDLLPIDMPAAFPEGVASRFGEWLEVVATHGNNAVCISTHVATRMKAWLEARGGGPGLEVVKFSPGVDRCSVATPTERPDTPPALLMVGTLEPRKGYGVALDAMERIWSSGTDASLTIVGRQGWSVDEFVSRLLGHREFGKRLFWQANATDQEVRGHYARSHCLLACSIAEGLGLPLLEAGAQGLHLIVRDIPEFREVAGDGATYFGAREGGGPHDAIVQWMSSQSHHGPLQVAATAGRFPPDWKQSAIELFNAIAVRSNMTPTCH